MSPDTHKTLLRELRRLARRRGWTVPEWKFQRALVFCRGDAPGHWRRRQTATDA